jgi:hypothetical protein
MRARPERGVYRKKAEIPRGWGFLLVAKAGREPNGSGSRNADPRSVCRPSQGKKQILFARKDESGRALDHAKGGLLYGWRVSSVSLATRSWLSSPLLIR